MVAVVWQVGDLCGRRRGGVNGGCFRMFNTVRTESCLEGFNEVGIGEGYGVGAAVIVDR